MGVMDVWSCGQLLARQGRGIFYLGIGRASRLALIISSCPPHLLFIPSGAAPDWNGRCQWGLKDRILKLERNGRSIGVCTGLPRRIRVKQCCVLCNI